RPSLFPPGGIPSRTVSVWRLTGLLFEIVLDAIRLPLSLGDIFNALHRRSRHLIRPQHPRRRYQRTDSRFVARRLS
ncbi:MAG TPA: hypothetical protein VFV49_15945, partial [Thermoanaerobaculia bacterium]|nr:hypothetical protein [Thermoanaerobaculia bacterium]